MAKKKFADDIGVEFDTADAVGGCTSVSGPRVVHWRQRLPPLPIFIQSQQLTEASRPSQSFHRRVLLQFIFCYQM